MNKVNLPPQYLPERRGKIKDTYADIYLAGQAINYSPIVSITDGLQQTVNWFSDQQ